MLARSIPGRFAEQVAEMRSKLVADSLQFDNSAVQVPGLASAAVSMTAGSPVFRLLFSWS